MQSGSPWKANKPLMTKMLYAIQRSVDRTANKGQFWATARQIVKTVNIHTHALTFPQLNQITKIY